MICCHSYPVLTSEAVEDGLGMEGDDQEAPAKEAEHENMLKLMSKVQRDRRRVTALQLKSLKDRRSLQGLVLVCPE